MDTRDNAPGGQPAPGFLSVFSGRADMRNDAPMAAILKLAIPSMALFLFNSLLHLADTIFVSWLGELPMAAMSFTSPVNMCIFATLECVCSGAISLMGRNLGRGDLRSARHVARGGLFLLYAVCLISTPMIFPSVSNALFSAIGAGGNPELLDLCWKYNMWYPVMLPFMGYTYIANTIFRAQGDTFTPFKAMALANTINIVLDPILIFNLGWGISGAAIATWISRIVSSLYIWHRLNVSSQIKLPPLIRVRRRLLSYWIPILWIGVPVGLSTASAALGMGSVNRILSTFGHRAVASWMLGLRVEELAFNFVNGINIAMTPYIAFNYGKRDPERMLAGFKSALLIAFVLMGGIGAIIYAFPHFFLGIFKPVAEIEYQAAQSIRASVPGYPFNIFLVLSSGFFVGTGHSIYGTASQLLRSIVFRVSAAWIFAQFFPLSRIWWFQSLAFMLGSLVAMTFFAHHLRALRREFARKDSLL